MRFQHIKVNDMVDLILHVDEVGFYVCKNTNR